jgi:hypothetical protein
MLMLQTMLMLYTMLMSMPYISENRGGVGLFPGPYK